MRPNLASHTCPLCQAAAGDEIYQDKHRNYLRCRICNLVFVPPAQFLSAVEEKARYGLHQNSPEDLAYRRFLSRLFLPLQKLLAPRSCGLDFGSGPGPTLSVMFAEAGHSMAIYDHFYARDPSVWEKQYDFITATEVVEHLHNPQKDLHRLWACLKPGGRLGIMTKLALGQEAFARWHYKNDLTHVCFFSQSTFAWLADQWRADLTFANKDVIILAKNSTHSRVKA